MFWNTRLFITIKGIMRERNLVVLKDHIITVNWERRKELWDHHKLSEQSVSRVFGSYSQNTAFFLIFPRPWPTVPVVCMACDNHINLCCLSLSPPYFFFSPSALLLFSLTLWKPKELVRAWLTLLFLLLLHHVICVTCLRFCLFLSWCLWAHS